MNILHFLQFRASQCWKSSVQFNKGWNTFWITGFLQNKDAEELTIQTSITTQVHQILIHVLKSSHIH